MFDLFNKWDWLLVSAAGAFLFLMGYGVLPMDEAWYKKNKRLMRVSGFLALLVAIGLFLLRNAAPSPRG